MVVGIKHGISVVFNLTYTGALPVVLQVPNKMLAAVLGVLLPLGERYKQRWHQDGLPCALVLHCVCCWLRKA